jgi:hypothetical protein
MFVYKQWDVTFNIICDFSTIIIFVLTASNEIFFYFHVTSKKTAPNFWVTLLKSTGSTSARNAMRYTATSSARNPLTAPLLLSGRRVRSTVCNPALLRFCTPYSGHHQLHSITALSLHHTARRCKSLAEMYSNGSASNTRYLFESRTHGLRNPTTHHQFSSLFLRL